MSMDKSLKTKGNLARHRNVLTRAERVAKLMEHEQLKEGDSVFGLTKVAHRKAKVGGKDKKKEATTTEGTPTPETPAK